MKGSYFIFYLFKTTYQKCHEANFRRGGSYIESLDWIRKKKATINPKNKDDKCFQYAAMAALNYEGAKWNPEPVLNIRPFTNKYKKGMNYPSKINDWKIFEENNPTIALNILCIKEQ